MTAHISLDEKEFYYDDERNERAGDNVTTNEGDEDTHKETKK